MDALFVEEATAAHDLGQAADLPGDLVDRDLVGLARREQPEDLAREQDERVVIGAVPREVALGVGIWPESLALLVREARAEVGLVGDRKAEQITVKVNARFDVVDVYTEVPEPPDAEGSIQQNAADIKAAASVCFGWALDVGNHGSPPSFLQASG